jgi:hypothetical protein
MSVVDSVKKSQRKMFTQSDETQPWKREKGRRVNKKESSGGGRERETGPAIVMQQLYSNSNNNNAHPRRFGKCTY